ncbi:MAG: hypothetical protein Q4E89_10120 [Eubacteriales bacterium]|nr:hypothetical protein [Eubacteriales bacterium]
MKAWIKKQFKKLAVSIAVGFLAAASLQSSTACTVSFPIYREYAGAWWGWLYPQYCFAGDGEDTGEKQFSFWLAKALEW